MALEINNIDGVICLKGNVTNSHAQEIKGYFKALLTIQDIVNINLCQIKEGTKELTSALKSLTNDISENKTLNYYGFAEPAVKQLYAQINSLSNFYQAA